MKSSKCREHLERGRNGKNVDVPLSQAKRTPDASTTGLSSFRTMAKTVHHALHVIHVLATSSWGPVGPRRILRAI